MSTTKKKAIKRSATPDKPSNDTPKTVAKRKPRARSDASDKSDVPSILPSPEGTLLLAPSPKYRIISAKGIIHSNVGNHSPFSATLCVDAKEPISGEVVTAKVKAFLSLPSIITVIGMDPSSYSIGHVTYLDHLSDNEVSDAISY